MNCVETTLTAGLLAPSLTGAAPESAVLLLYRRYRELAAAADAWQAPPGMDPMLCDQLWEQQFHPEMDKIRDEMMALPCVGPADFAAKVLVASADGSLLSWRDGGALAAEARVLVGHTHQK